MSEEKNSHGGKRERAGRPPKDIDKRKHRYFLTDAEKELVDTYRQSQEPSD